MITSCTSTVPGRVCLLGDKSDLLGGPVIAAAISKFFNFNFKLIDGDKYRFVLPEQRLEFEDKLESSDSNSFFKFFSRISMRFKDKIRPFECSVTGDLPIGAGLSSSAACSIGFISGLNKLFGLKLNYRDMAELAYQVERNDLKIMCGRMDQYSIAYGGVTFIETGEQTRVTKLKNRSIPLVIGDSCEPRMAASVLNTTMQKLNEKDPRFLACFKLLNENVIEGLEALKRNNLPELGARMSMQQGIEKAIFASTPKLEEMCQAAIKAGALGAKQIGAGGGGCMIALCPHNMDKVIEALKKLGANVWKANIYTEHVV